LKIIRTETVEFGYKGVIGDRLVVGVDLYRSNVDNFVGPFQVGTPNVFIDTAALQFFLNQRLASVLADPSNAAALSDLMPLDEIPGLGNGDGSPANELSFLVSTGLAGSVPFGTVSPEESFDPTAVLLVRRNFGDITLYGCDLHFSYFASPRWTFGGSYSHVSDNLFRDVDGVDDIALNAPRHKASGLLRYTAPAREFSTELRVRYVGGFPVRSDVYIGSVDAYTLLDLSFHYRVPFSAGTQLTVTVQNLLNNEHQEFVDVPEIGRLALLRLTHSF
ncbi:MAG: TonB-dependent receptor, partial [Rhodothermia bacterium]|nr:TonB-dependent receptor [Rhodothermia bacterium]